MKIHWHASQTLERKMVIFLNRHHQMLRLSERNLSLLNNCTANDSNFIEDKSQQTAGQASETGQNLFERCIYTMLLLREKRVVLSPMLERTSVCGIIADEQCLRRQCEISIVCDDGSFSSPKECALALSFSSPKECDKVASKPGFNHTKWD